MRVARQHKFRDPGVQRRIAIGPKTSVYDIIKSVYTFAIRESEPAA
jgi:hypothetical protein